MVFQLSGYATYQALKLVFLQTFAEQFLSELKSVRRLDRTELRRDDA